MALSLTHAFVSAVADGGDASQVRPSNWNEEHAITAAANKLIGTDGSGDGAEIGVGAGLAVASSTLSLSPIADTAANIADAAAAINTTGKTLYKQVWDTTNNRLMVAVGTGATDLWWVADGSASVTPS